MEDIQQISVALYRFMCKHIVGSEKTVKTKRILMTFGDNLSYTKYLTPVTSGSFGEGLEMKGSDFDMMYVLNNLKVENISEIQWNPLESYFTMDTADTKPGFVKLLLLYTVDNTVKTWCVEHEGGLYLSNQLIKLEFQSDVRKVIPLHSHLFEVNHGPCLSDKNGLYDMAFCLHSRSWIRQADHWKTRPNSSWPSDDVKSHIIEHGLLFVPIGIKGSPNEEIEWRVSFSVGEKLLIYSFTQTQLLCYALMKIILKDIISSDKNCKDLLCSYYIKNIMFWVSEELPILIWKPANMIHCLMRCFRRLIYCVEYSLCPHYFIPENNMFENKIEGKSRRVLLDVLKTLYTFDWRLVLFSSQLRDFLSVPCILGSKTELFIDEFEHINKSAVLSSFVACQSDTTQLSYILSRFKLKPYHSFYLSTAFRDKDCKVEFKDRAKNKEMYNKYKLCQSTRLLGLQSDAVAGWLKLASFFYEMRQYRKVLEISNYSLSKCTQEKIITYSKLSYDQRKHLDSRSLQNNGIISIMKLLLLEIIKFSPDSKLIPRELKLEDTSRFSFIPPVVFAHFLCFLCHFHLNDAEQVRHSLDDLHLTISEEYFIPGVVCKSTSYNCLGIALQLVGDKDSAIQAFRNAVLLDPIGCYSCARQRLSMLTTA